MNFCIRTISALLLIALISFGCSREMGEGNSVVKIVTPKEFMKASKPGNLAAPDVLPNRLECWGVNVVDPTALPAAQSCGESLGEFAGFVPGGAELAVSVPSGSGLKVQLFLHLALEGQTTCPTWDAAFNSNGNNTNSRTYVVGTRDGIEATGDSVDVTISATPPVDLIAESVGTLSGGGTNCIPPVGSVRGEILSNGDVLDASGTFNPTKSKPHNESLIQTSDAPAFIGTASSGALIDFNGAVVQAAPFVTSLTRKPDGKGEYYGLTHGGQVVMIDPSSGLPVAGAPCPFISCTVPPWILSVSAGLGPNLTGMDHAGQIYLIGSGGTTSPLSIPARAPFTQHFSMF